MLTFRQRMSVYGALAILALAGLLTAGVCRWQMRRGLHRGDRIAAVDRMIRSFWFSDEEKGVMLWRIMEEDPAMADVRASDLAASNLLWRGDRHVIAELPALVRASPERGELIQTLYKMVQRRDVRLARCDITALASALAGRARAALPMESIEFHALQLIAGLDLDNPPPPLFNPTRYCSWDEIAEPRLSAIANVLDELEAGRIALTWR